MKLVDFDLEVMQALSERGFTCAVIKPIVLEGTNMTINEEKTMEVVPFHDFSEASQYLDSLEEEGPSQSTIVEISDGLAKDPTSGNKKFHLLVDAESAGFKAA